MSMNLTKLGMILAIAALAGTSAGTIPILVSGQNMTGNVTGGQNTTADINQTGNISGTRWGTAFSVTGSR